jgi:hypothetical protein
MLVARRADMIKIAITEAAFEAIAKTLPLGSVGYENKTNDRGERLIWLERSVVDRLRNLRGPQYVDSRHSIVRDERPLRSGRRARGNIPGRPQL